VEEEETEKEEEEEEEGRAKTHFRMSGRGSGLLAGCIVLDKSSGSSPQ
jgi:hypothetical protein